MYKKNKQNVWIPFALAACIALGIFIGNYYNSLAGKTDPKVYMGNASSFNNKIESILGLINKEYVDSVNISDIIEATIPTVFAQLDPHSVYIPAKDAQAVNDELSGSFSGIGVSFNIVTDTILIISVIHGGPSEKAGLLPFDRIVTINDSLFVGKSLQQNDVIKNLKGLTDTTVKLGIKRGDNKQLIYFNVTRGKIPVNSVDVSYKLAEGIGYIKVNKFGRTTYAEFITGIAKLKSEGCKAFVIDLRGNTGGYMQSCIKMVNEFLPKNTLIVYTEGKAFPRSDMFTDGTGTCIDDPIVVLTDEYSASASEIFSGAIQDNDRGMIIGRRTFGKGLVQTQVTLKDKSEVRITIARYYTPSGRCIQKEYTLGEEEDYNKDIYNRFMRGEFFSKDSIKRNVTDMHLTKLGRKVYGGGGIMPDVFIPRDTTALTSYLSRLLNTGLLFKFALTYSENHKEPFEQIADWHKVNDFLKKDKLVDKVVAFASKNGIRKRMTLIRISSAIIERQARAYILRNFFDDEAFYPVFQEDDTNIEEAIKLIKTNKWKPQFVAVDTLQNGTNKDSIPSTDQAA